MSINLLPTDPFYKRLYTIIAALSLICGVFIGLTWLQGPRIRLAAIDTTRVTTQSGQRLILRTNQPLDTDSANKVNISPSTPIQTSASGNTIIIQFKHRLAYQTAYTVTLKSDNHRLKHTFTTPKPIVYYAEQDGAGAAHTIRRKILGTDKTEVVYRAENILDFAVLSDALVVTTGNADYTHNLVRIDLKTKQERAVALPKSGTVAHLYSAPDKQSFGFSFSPKTYEKALNNALFLVRGTDLKPQPVKGFANKFLPVLDWKFASDSATILAQLPDTTTLITDTRTNKPPVPLGQYVNIGGFSADGTKAIVHDKDGPIAIDLATNAQTRLSQQAIGSDSFTTSTLPFHNTAGYLFNGQAFINSYYLDYIQVQSGRMHKVLHQTSKTEGIIATELSPNDQYAAVTVNEPHDGLIDTQTHIIELKTGAMQTLTDSAKAHW